MDGITQKKSILPAVRAELSEQHRILQSLGKEGFDKGECCGIRELSHECQMRRMRVTPSGMADSSMCNS